MNAFKRDVALRSGLSTALVALFALLSLAVVFWFFLSNQLTERVEDSLLARHATAQSNLSVLSSEERATIRKFRRTLPVRDDGLFAWINKDGDIFSSNVTGVDCRDGFYNGWVDVSKQSMDVPLALLNKDQIDKSTHDQFRFLATNRGEDCLVFGSSMYAVNALSNNALGLFLWLVPLFMLPSLLISLTQSWSLRRRLKRLGNVVQSLAAGDLNARMPVDGDDDIDRLAHTANRSFDRLQDSVNTLQQLTSVVAHDLRAPLNRITIPLERAINQNEDGETAVDTLHEVRTGLDDARAVFDALLRISQIESGRRRTQFKVVDLHALAQEMHEIYQPVVEGDGRTLNLEVAGGGTSLINGDKDLLRQALVNLIENAIRYTPENASITIGMHRGLKNQTLLVKDNGKGVPEAERPRVLQRLYRYEGSTQGQSGHGLGLALVKAIVDLHDGDITLEDAEPGLLVKMLFPAIEE